MAWPCKFLYNVNLIFTSLTIPNSLPTIEDICSSVIITWSACYNACAKVSCFTIKINMGNRPKQMFWGAYHLARKSGNFGSKSNGKVIFRKFRSEIVEYLQRYSSFSVRSGTAEISLPFAKLSSFQSLISRKLLREIEVQMVSAISFGWFADFGKTLTIIQRSSQPVYSDKW